MKTQPIPILPFRPDRSGLERWLPPVKALILEYLFDADYPRTVKQVWRAIGSGRALTTIQTHLLTMAASGLLTRNGAHTATFAPALSRLEFERYQTDGILRSLGYRPVESEVTL